jgi:TldD protein
LNFTHAIGLFEARIMEDVAEAAIDHALRNGAEFADLRMESFQGTIIVVMDGRTKTITTRIERGCGIRAFIDGGWGFAVSNDLDIEVVREAAETAARLAKVSKEKAKVRFKIDEAPSNRRTDAYPCRVSPSSVPVSEKLTLAMSLDKAMESHDDRVVSRNTRYEDFEGRRIVANSFGSLVVTDEWWTLASCSAWARSDGIVQRGHESVGNVGGYEVVQTGDASEIGLKAAAQAVRLLDSKPVPAGKFTCVLDNRMTGLLAHEALGHACEADIVLSGASVLEGMQGKRVASESVTLVDDPTITDTFGYFAYDWEGVKSSKHTLIDKGVLTGFMNNLETSSRMGVPANGAGRAETYSSPPIVRMSNTFIAPGSIKKEELIEDVPDGMLIVGAQYGYVDPAKGQFMFKCDEAYRIEKGEIGQRYRDAILSGLVLEALHGVTGVADDFSLTDPGYCGKSGQDARTTDGGPHIRVENILVGGLA